MSKIHPIEAMGVPVEFIEDTSNIKRCPGYKHLRMDGAFNPSCGNVWDASPPPHGEGSLCPKCWHKPSRDGKRIVMLDGSDHKIPEAALNLTDQKNKVIVSEQHLVTEKGQNWDEYEWDEKLKIKRKIK